MPIQNALQVLRSPKAANAYYHQSCYQWDGKEPVLHILRLLHDEKCVVCHQWLLGQEPLVQLSLFEEKGTQYED